MWSCESSLLRAKCSRMSQTPDKEMLLKVGQWDRLWEGLFGNLSSLLKARALHPKLRVLGVPPCPMEAAPSCLSVLPNLLLSLPCPPAAKPRVSLQGISRIERKSQRDRNTFMGLREWIRDPNPALAQRPHRIASRGSMFPPLSQERTNYSCDPLIQEGLHLLLCLRLSHSWSRMTSPGWLSRGRSHVPGQSVPQPHGC